MRKSSSESSRGEDIPLLSDEELLATPKLREWAGGDHERTEAERQDELSAAPSKVWAGSDDPRAPHERVDELALADTSPPLPTASALAGWAAGRRQRVILGIALASLLPMSLVLYRQLKLWVHAQRVAAWQPTEETRDSPRSREMTWSGGFGRLGLERGWPGVLVVHLPDRDIVLEDGYDRAIFAVDVVDGATTYLKVTHGAIRQLPPGSYRPDAIEQAASSASP